MAETHHDQSKPDSDSAKLVHGSIAGHIFRQTYPVVFGVAAIMSIGIIDAYFVGNLGPDNLAAISFIFPVTTALSSLGVGVIAGTSSVVSRALGKGDDEAAAEAANVAVLLSFVIGVAIAAALYFGRTQLFELMQAEEAQLGLIDAYMVPFALAFPLLLLVMGFNGVLRGQGAAKRSTAILISFAAANWVLDPILINGAFGFEGLGIVGASYATVAGWALGCAVGFWLMQTGQLPFHPRHLARCDWRASVTALARVAGPASFSNAINPIGLSVLTAMIAAEGASAVAGFGIGGRLQTFAVVPLLALSSSIGAIVGQNWGAEEMGRVRRALMISFGFCVVYGLAAAAVLFVGRDWFSSRFSDDAAAVQASVRYLQIAVWGYAAYGLLIVANGVFNAIDRAGVALALSVARVLLVMVPFAWVLRGSWGADAIYAAELASNLAGAAASLLVCAMAVGLFGMKRRAEAAT
ncbi:MATE family efflux transporter [Aurantiacibacter luteus]|uniref:Sodium transporter n=1 Tax=Aurantiacibacter luteus TaxID=1581420 RepID=A0A0G9MP32_9SPHN|nr:MATE family efflux transporter [Aurantiacibacter luteus]KLE32349.1 sodium transporter [Aurantiacibacter luteus]